ncbi:hypothetical protein FB45DRAFT_797959 [Roridomyces roridus]|uniref:Uncharacterized protein n=1 Tax=Roridomyces roridus TaxID=1738132 RepID=A0AAD7FH70_9AGAR|nr:hypothetical protein FB45DRAFT_797959 [Roridomyces roridus]
MGVKTRRRPLLALLAASISLAWLFHTFWSPSSSLQSARWIQRDPFNRWDAPVAPTVTVTVQVPEPTPPLLMNDVPTGSFRDNLRPELKYISGWPTSGWNNQVMEYMNLIYLGLITERIPILAPFARKKRHGVKSEEFVPFSRLFNISRMQEEVGVRVLEWGEVKDLTSAGTLDGIGCWSMELGVWNASWRSLRPHNLKLDISYTPTPEWVKLVPGDYRDQQATFWSLAALAFEDTRPANVDLSPEPGPIQQSIYWPDERLLCFDNMYFICAHQAWEFDKQYSPAWRFVGQYMRFSSEMQDIADECIRKALGVEEHEEIPLYIAIHVRRGDFKNACNTKEVTVKPEDCLAPLSAYAQRVEEVREEIFKTKGMRIGDGDVIMTTDETDEGWWTEVLQLGWKRVDHGDVLARHGPWYPTFVDGVIQGGGLGFVGTHRSTVSILADRRVLEWQKGATRTVYWGRNH